MQSIQSKLKKLFLVMFSFMMLTALSSLDYTRKDELLPNMPEGSSDLNLGIVVREHSTGRDVLADSSKNIRFVGSKNYKKTDIEQLSSSSLVDRTPKKFKFIDKNHSFSSDNIYEFSIYFNNKNHQWQYIRFMPFASVTEWVTKDKLKIYLDQWVKTFEDAGWERIEHAKSDNPYYIQNFRLPEGEYDKRQYCSWKTQEYKAVIDVRLRNPPSYSYKGYVSKTEREKIQTSPDAYIAFIEIIKKSQYR